MLKTINITNIHNPNEVKYTYDYDTTRTRRCTCGNIIRMEESDISTHRCTCGLYYSIFYGEIKSSYEISSSYHDDEEEDY